MFSYVTTLVFLVSHVELRLLVHTPVGSIQGVPADDGDYAMFLGIPYAKVNISNPFGASIPYEKFTKVFEAFNESAVCPQMREIYLGDDDPYSGTLDCLSVNVYVPNTDTKNKAVYIYIFGGKWDHGESKRNSYGPKYLIRHDIIVVTFNHRLGPYGFLCMDIPEIPPNQGLWDQYNAMKWVAENIPAFGGDPQKITIGGHSSGAMSVNMHMLTKQPRHFQQVILQSGSATAPGFLNPADANILIKIADKLGYKTNNTYAAITFLAKVSPETIIKTTVTEYEWSPCVEKQIEGIVPFIDENPELSEGINIDGLNILGGFTNNECAYTLYSPSYSHLLGKQEVLQSDLALKFNLPNNSNAADIVSHFYLGDDRGNKSKMIEFISDFDFVYPLQRELIKYAKHRDTNVYQYMFSYEGHLNRMKRFYNMTEPGATHSDELGYIFTMDFIPDIPNVDDQRKIDQITTLWTNFIKYGNPTPVTTELLPVSWPSLTADSVPCLKIDTNLTLISRPFQRSMAFWDLFFDTYPYKLIQATPA